jgi:hypothetical protein
VKIAVRRHYNSNEDYDDRDDAILRSAHQDMVTLTGNDLLADASMY